MTDTFIYEFLDYLNLIHHVSVGEDIQRTQNVINNIATIIQYKYIRSSELVTLKEELNKNDLLIEVFKERFGGKLQFIKEVKEVATNILIPNYVVLAFVENALFHGLVPKEGEWKLSLKIDENEKAVQIKITDNGVGFDTSVLVNKNISMSDYIGTIPYVITQLKTSFSDMGEVNIVSSNNKGTKVNIKIPKI